MFYRRGLTSVIELIFLIALYYFDAYLWFNKESKCMSCTVR